MLRTASKKTVNDGPSARRGPSLWLVLAGAGLMIVGLLYFRSFQDKAKINSKPVAKEAVAKPVSETGMETSAAVQVDHHPPHQLVSEDPLAVSVKEWLQRIGAEADPMGREKLTEEFLGGVDVADIPEALAVLQNGRPAALAAELGQRLVRRWTKADPQTAADWVDALPAGTARQRGLENVAIVWANDNATNAIQWARSLANDTERFRALAAVANEAVRFDPMSALEVAVKLPANSQCNDLIRRAAAEWAANDPSNAVAWAKQIPDVSLRAQVLASEATAWAGQEPRAAAVLAVTELPAGRLQDDTVMTIVERWARQQPQAAADWVAQFPAGPLRDTALQNIRAQVQQQQEEETSTGTGRQQM